MIRVENLSLRLPGFSLREINLELAEGEFFALIGPTGSGKTLILESLAGLKRVSSGRIFLGGRDITGLPPESRGVGIVYQDQALFPHMSVIRNITYGLRYAPKGAGSKVDSLLERLGLGRLRDRNVTTLSGGEAQRVALARALIVEPRVLLLDEPLSSLDPAFRHELQVLLKNLHQETGLTCLMVSHDFGEVMSLAGRAAVIHQGRIRQTGGVADIFQRPATPFVARFVGMKNVFPALFKEASARVEGLTLDLEKSPGCEKGHVAIKPGKIRLAPNGEGAAPGVNRFSGRLSGVLDLGPVWEARIEAQGLELLCLVGAERAGELMGRVGETLSLCLAPDDIHVIPG